MVHTNNNLKNKKKLNKEKDSSAIYPFEVDVPSFPERKYLAGIYRFAKISYISLFISIILCILIIVKSFSRTVKPVFIYWNKFENKFDFKPTKYTFPPKVYEKNISESNYLDEYFIRTYLEKRFSISNTYLENYNNWCDCSKDKKDITSMGIFDLNQKCYICNYSSSDIYNTFKNNEYSAYTQLAEEGITRKVIILNIETLFGQDSTKQTTFIDWILNKTYQTKVFKRYKIDFIIQEEKKDKITSQDVLIAYLELTGIKDFPESRGITSASYMYNPNYDLVLKEYYLNSKGGKNDL